LALIFYAFASDLSQDIAYRRHQERPAATSPPLRVALLSYKPRCAAS